MKKFLAKFILDYLRFFAKLQLKKNPQATVIGITGSAGKTSCQQAVVAALGANQQQYRVKFNHKANSESGIPLDILGLKVKDYSLIDWSRLLILAPLQLLINWQKFDFYVVEMGVDSPHEPKNMTYLLKIIQPQIGVLLNAQNIHSAAFDALVTETDIKQRRAEITELIAQEKGKLLLSLTANGTAIFNKDDQQVKKVAQASQAQKLGFSHKTNSDLKLLDWQVSLAGSKFLFEQQDQQLKLHFKNVVLGQHYWSVLAATILVAEAVGLDWPTIKNNLEKYWQLEPGRSSLIEGVNQSYLLDSSYNASGMLEMIQLSQDLSHHDRKIKRSLAILGDMRELGTESQELHQLVAKKAAEQFSIVYLVGPLMKKYALPILQKASRNRRYTIKEVDFFVDSATAGRQLVREIRPGDLILLKGSQNTIFIEKATKILMNKPQLANKLLCRQSSWWRQQKALAS